MVFDTNVLVYAVRQEAEFHAACRRFVDAAVAGLTPAYLTWNVCYEFLRVITHPGIYRPAWNLLEGYRFLNTLLRPSGFQLLTPTDRHAAVLRQVASEVSAISGNLVHDLHTVVLMREHGVHQICTRDADFRRFPFLEVVDPADARRA